MRIGRVIAAVVAAAVPFTLMAVPGQAFMTWDPPGNAEHERITRMAIACNSAFVRQTTLPAGVTWQDLCLQSRPPGDGAPNGTNTGENFRLSQEERSLRMLAGAKSYLGGVGAPDSIKGALFSKDGAHCDNADAWLVDAPWPGGYPRSLNDRNQGLRDCLSNLQRYVGTAVDKAGSLVTADGMVSTANTDLTRDCYVEYDPVYSGDDEPNAKCASLIAFGRALHIVEDFFSHSNWVDVNPTTPGASQPPGLFTPPTVLPEALGYPRSAEQIDAFIDGTEVITGAYPSDSNVSRIYHDYGLTKDAGVGKIDWTDALIPAGKAGKTGRGTVAVGDGTDNFQRAVTGATHAAARLWVDFYSAIITRYGDDRGTRIWRALRETTPWTRCHQFGEASGAIRPPNGEQKAARTVTVNIVNRTGGTLGCDTARLDGGEWSSLPPDSIGPGQSGRFKTLSNGFATGTYGAVEVGGVRIEFTNPYAGSNTFRCLTAQFDCRLVGGKGFDPVVTVTLTSKATASGAEAARTSGRDRLVTTKKPGRAPERPATTFADRQGSDVNPRISRPERRLLDEEVGTVGQCGGRGEAIELAVDDIHCDQALRLLKDRTLAGYEDFCPPGWQHQHNPPANLDGPDDGATICVDQTSTKDGRDAFARAFLYHMAHTHGDAH